MELLVKFALILYSLAMTLVEFVGLKLITKIILAFLLYEYFFNEYFKNVFILVFISLLSSSLFVDALFGRLIAPIFRYAKITITARRGMKVRPLDRGNLGTITSLDYENKKAEVYFYNNSTGNSATRFFEIWELRTLDGLELSMPGATPNISPEMALLMSDYSWHGVKVIDGPACFFKISTDKYRRARGSIYTAVEIFAINTLHDKGVIGLCFIFVIVQSEDTHLNEVGMIALNLANKIDRGKIGQIVDAKKCRVILADHKTYQTVYETNFINTGVDTLLLKAASRATLVDESLCRYVIDSLSHKFMEPNNIYNYLADISRKKKENYIILDFKDAGLSQK